MANFIIIFDSQIVLQKSFHEIDRHHDGGIDETELRDSLVHFMEFSTKKA
jgi:Ca2+-binding EF-hand superfamily protein